MDAPPDPEPNSSRRRAPSYILLVDKEQLEYSKLLQLIDSISKCSDWSHEQLRNLESRIIRAREEYDGTANDLWAYQKTAGAEAEARDSDRKHQSVTNAVESAIDKIHKFSAYVNSTPKLSPIQEVSREGGIELVDPPRLSDEHEQALRVPTPPRRRLSGVQLEDVRNAFLPPHKQPFPPASVSDGKPLQRTHILVDNTLTDASNAQNIRANVPFFSVPRKNSPSPPICKQILEQSEDTKQRNISLPLFPGESVADPRAPLATSEGFCSGSASNRALNKSFHPSQPTESHIDKSLAFKERYTVPGATSRDFFSLDNPKFRDFERQSTRLEYKDKEWLSENAHDWAFGKNRALKEISSFGDAVAHSRNHVESATEVTTGMRGDTRIDVEYFQDPKVANPKRSKPKHQSIMPPKIVEDGYRIRRQGTATIPSVDCDHSYDSETIENPTQSRTGANRQQYSHNNQLINGLSTLQLEQKVEEIDLELHRRRGFAQSPIDDVESYI